MRSIMTRSALCPGLRGSSRNRLCELAQGGTMVRRQMAAAAVLLALPLTAMVQVQAQANTSGAQVDKDNSLTAPQGPIFQLDVRRVPVDVVVTDKQGNPVRGLTRDDF